MGALVRTAMIGEEQQADCHLRHDQRLGQREHV